jgi:hypothetical protein
MGVGLSVLAGPITEIKPTYIVVGVVRIELRDGQSPTSFQLGDRVTVTAVPIGVGMYLAEKIVRHDDRPLFGDLPSF